MHVRIAGSLAIALSLTGCGGGGADPDPEGDPEVEIGTGTTSFEPIAQSGEIEVVQGPQGGFHVFGSVRVRSMVPGDPENLADEDNPTTEFLVHRGQQRIDSGVSKYRQGLAPSAASPGSFEMIGRLVILDITDDAELDGVEIEVSVTVTDASGASASDVRTVIAVPHPDNP